MVRTNTMAILEVRSHARLSEPEFAKQLSKVLTQIPSAADVSSPYQKFPERPFEVIT